MTNPDSPDSIPSEVVRKLCRPSSPRPQLESWRKTLHAHEQVAVGQPTAGSETKIIAFLDEIEQRLHGQEKAETKET